MDTTRMAELFPLVVDAGVRGLVLLAVAGVLALALRRSAAATRHLVWFLALAALLVLPVAMVVVPEVRVLPVGGAEPAPVEAVGSVTETASEPASRPDAISAVGAGVPIEPGVVTSGEREGAVNASPARETVASPRPAGDREVVAWPALLVLVWGLGAVGLLAPVLVGWAGVRRLERRSRRLGEGPVLHLATRVALRIGLRREFELRLGPPRTMPMTWGVARARVLLPEDALDWPEARVEAVLLHELAHVVRRDCLTQLVAEVARALHWLNPLAWVATRQLRVEREHACDDVALEGGARPSAYADELLGLARSYRTPGAMSMAAVAMARRSQIADRLLAVLDDARSRAGVARRVAVRSTLVAVALVLPLAAMAPAQAPADPPAPTQEAPAPAMATPAHEPAGTAGPVGTSGTLAAPAAAAPAEPRPEPASEPARSALAGGAIIPIHPAIAASPAERRAVDPAPVAASVSVLLSQQATCLSEGGDWDTMQHRSNDDRSTIVMRRRGCEVEVRLEGDVDFDAEGIGIARMSRDALFRVEEDDGRTERRLDVTPGAGGAPEYAFRVNGREQAFDSQAQAWFRAALLQLFRGAGFAADERVEALLRQGGVESVLREMGRIESSFVFARYASSLLERAELEEAAVRALVRTATGRVDSDHYMAEILKAVAAHQPVVGGMLDDYITASLSLDSDHYRSEVLRGVIRSGRLSGDQIEAVLKATGEMDSDHYRAEMLREVADRYALEPSFRPAYLAATAGMDSDHYRTQVLSRLLDRNDISASEKAAVLEAARMVDSDHYRTELLKKVAARGLDEPALHRAFFAGAASLDSDHYYREAMTMLVDQPRLEPELLTEVLGSAAREVGSDHYLSELLLRVLERHPITGGVRQAFLAAMDSIGSTHYRGRVADALLRSER